MENKGPANYLAGYAYLQYEYERNLLEEMPTLDAFSNAVEQCKTRKYLKGIVEKEDFIAMFNDILSYDNQLIAEGRIEGKTERDNEIAHKAFTGLNQGSSASSIIKMLKDLGIPDSIIESAHEQAGTQTIKN